MKTLSSNEQQFQYEIAAKRVKRIKGFYIHLLVFTLINTFFIINNILDLKDGESIFQFNIFATTLFWGIGLAAHCLSVFGPNIFFGQDWEEKKIKQFIEKEQQLTQKWN